MGLDMYALRVEKKDIINDCKICNVSEAINRDFYYWRKHYPLDNYFTNLYREKGGGESEFNCEFVRVDENDLNNLQELLIEGYLYDYCEEDERSMETLRDDLNFIKEAKNEIMNGYAVYYTNWW